MKTLPLKVLGWGLMGWALLSLAGCGGSSSSSIVKLTTSATLSGVALAAGSEPVAGVTVNLFLVINQDDLLGELLFSPPAPDDDSERGQPDLWVGHGGPNVGQGLVLPTPTLVASMTTNGVGRFSFDDLEFGLYDVEFDLVGSSHTGLAPLRFDNRPHLDEDILQQLQDANLLRDDTVGRFMTVFFPPLVGSVAIVSNIAAPQTLVFDDGAGGDPLPGLSLLVPPNLQVVKDGAPLADGASTTLQLALVAPEQVPMSFRDELDRSRTNQLFFSLQPVGVEFVVPDSYDVDLGLGTPMLVQVTYPNVNGLAPGASVELFRFDHENPFAPEKSFQWVAAGTGTVNGAGTLVEPDLGAGLPEAGWHGAPGPPPPTVKVQGDLKLPDGSILAQAGVTVVTNNGSTGFTDAAGHYCIDEVPIIGGQTQLICRAFTDVSLSAEVATSAPQPVSFPTTTCDIVLSFQGSPLDTVPPTVESTMPAQGAVNVATDGAIEVVFDEVIDAFTLPGNLVVKPVAVGGSPQGDIPPVPGTIIPQPAGVGQTKAVFVPAAVLAPDIEYEVTVGPEVADLNGNPLGAAHVFSFSAGAVAAGVPQVFSMEPRSGPAGTTVEIRGVNLNFAAVTFDSGGLLIDSFGTGNTIGFTVPTLLDVAAGDKVVTIFESIGGAILAQFTFGLTPSITSLTPSTGLVGTTVVLAGSNFATDGSNLSVTFNSVPATLGGAGLLGGAVDDAQSVTVPVPAGASSGSVVLTVSTGFATSPAFFTVTAPLDVTAPTLVSSDPADLDTMVLVGSTIAVTFDELIATDATLTVTWDDGSPAGVVLTGTHLVTGDVSGGGVITFTPDVSFPFGAEITVASDVGTDLAGNLIVPFSFQFSTEANALTQDNPLDRARVGEDLRAVRASLEAVRDHADSSVVQVDKANFMLAFVNYALASDGGGSSSAGSAAQTLLGDILFPDDGLDLLDPGALTQPPLVDVDSPTCADLRAFRLRTGIPSVLALVDALEALPPALELSFVSPDDATTVEVDSTDVLGLTTLFKKSLLDMHYALAFGCSFDADGQHGAALPAADVRDARPDLGAVQSPADLIMAQGYAADVIRGYGLTLASLSAETDDQLDDLIVWDASLGAADQAAAAEALSSAWAKLKAATLSPPQAP